MGKQYMTKIESEKKILEIYVNLCQVALIFQVTKKVHETYDEKNEPKIRDQIMLTMFKYSQLQLTIKLYQVFKDITKVTNYLKHNCGQNFSQNIQEKISKLSNPFKGNQEKAWERLFTTCSLCNSTIGQSIDNTWEILEDKISQTRKKIKTFRDKVAAHTDKNAKLLTISLSTVEDAIKFIQYLLHDLYLIKFDKDIGLGVPHSNPGFNPDITAETIFKGIF